MPIRFKKIKMTIGKQKTQKQPKQQSIKWSTCKIHGHPTSMQSPCIYCRLGYRTRGY